LSYAHQARADCIMKHYGFQAYAAGSLRSPRHLRLPGRR